MGVVFLFASSIYRLRHEWKMMYLGIILVTLMAALRLISSTTVGWE